MGSELLYPAKRTMGRQAQRWLIGGALALAVAAAIVSTVVAQRQASQPVAPPTVVTAPAPIGPNAVEGPREYMDGYAIVDGQVMMRVSSRDSAAVKSRLVALEDGYYDEGPLGYYWRLRPGR
jgi:hypothetical protein